MKELAKLHQALLAFTNDFLVKNGGAGNGFDTYISGAFHIASTTGDLTVCIPGDEVTRRQLTELEYKFRDELVKVLPDWFVKGLQTDDYFLRFTPDHRASGCSTIGIELGLKYSTWRDAE